MQGFQGLFEMPRQFRGLEPAALRDSAKSRSRCDVWFTDPVVLRRQLIAKNFIVRGKGYRKGMCGKQEGIGEG